MPKSWLHDTEKINSPLLSASALEFLVFTCFPTVISELKRWNDNSKRETVALRLESIIKEQLNWLGLNGGTSSELSLSSCCHQRAGLEGCGISRLWKVRRRPARTPLATTINYRIQQRKYDIWWAAVNVVQIHKLCLCIRRSKWEFLRLLKYSCLNMGSLPWSLTSCIFQKL